MNIAQLNKLIDCLETMALNAGFSEKNAKTLAVLSVENASGVSGVEINIECAVDTMAAYIDDPSSCSALQ